MLIAIRDLPNLSAIAADAAARGEALVATGRDAEADAWFRAAEHAAGLQDALGELGQ